MDDDLYALARQSIDRRNRRLFLLGADVLAMFIYLAAFAAFGSIIPRNVGTFIAVVWIGALACHAMLLGVLQNRDAQIESEVERLRRAVYDEKPKRLELEDDGELVEIPVDERADKKQGNRL